MLRRKPQSKRFFNLWVGWEPLTYQRQCNSQHRKRQPICSGTTFAAYVAKTGETMRARTSEKDPRFPEGIIDLQVLLQWPTPPPPA